MPSPRSRTFRNNATGAEGGTRRAINAARFGGEVADRADARRASVYRSDVPHAPETQRDDPRREISELERAWIANRVHTLYVQRGCSILDIECDTDRSATFIKAIIFEHKFKKGKKVK